MKFRCDCETHILEITYTKPSKSFPWGDLFIAIYDIYSPKGRKYKKPKLIADVVIMNNKYPKELTKLLNWFPLNLDKLKRPSLQGKSDCICLGEKCEKRRHTSNKK